MERFTHGGMNGAMGARGMGLLGMKRSCGDSRYGSAGADNNMREARDGLIHVYYYPIFLSNYLKTRILPHPLGACQSIKLCRMLVERMVWFQL